MTRDKKAKKVRIFFSKSNQLVYGFKMAHKIKAIRERLDAVAAYRKFHLEEIHPVKTEVLHKARDQTHSFVLEEEVIGREDDKKEIIKLLLDSNVEENVSILPIVGMGGLGKTTLAQLVFNDEKFGKHFEKKMWACVSDNFNVKVIVEKILEPVTNKKPKMNLEMDTLVKELKKEIDEMRYFLILDDVWNEDSVEWLRLRNLLMGGARGTRIVVTTRSEKVAVITKSSHEPYRLKGLDEEKSWSLFKLQAFKKGQEPNSKFVKIGKEIVKKCVGVPLAIRMIGSLLYFKDSETDWLSFKDNELSKIPQDKNDILPTLKLSYDHLPSHLKQCFAYCSLFPKDYMISIPNLINLWIAQGFINVSNGNKCLEDVGHDYFMDLLWRSFFQEVEKDDQLGNLNICKMHDLMHDVATLVAEKESTILYLNGGNIDEKTCHVSFGFELSSLSQIPTTLFNASRIRTFLLPCQLWSFEKESFNVSTFEKIVSSFKVLHVLDMHETGICKVPSSISKLKHLRHLDLSDNINLEMLPNSICELLNLQTVKLSHCCNLKSLPKDIKKLVNLSYLQNDSCMNLTHMPHGLGQLTNLKTLSTFVVAKKGSVSVYSGLRELYGLKNLRGKLMIKTWGHCASLDANLKEKEHLQSLTLDFGNDADVGYHEMSLEGFEPHPNLKELSIWFYKGVRFPSWSLSNLVDFILQGCNKCQHLPPLDQLPYLKRLGLYELEALEYISQSEESGRSELSVSSFFPSLEYLEINKCRNLKGWRRKRNSVEDHHLLLQPSFPPRLSELRIWHCPKMTSLPLFPCEQLELDDDDFSVKPLQQTMMKNMESPTSTTSITSAPSTSLKTLRIYDCPILSQRCQREIGEDWPKISHIPFSDVS